MLTKDEKYIINTCDLCILVMQKRKKRNCCIPLRLFMVLMFACRIILWGIGYNRIRRG